MWSNTEPPKENQGHLSEGGVEPARRPWRGCGRGYSHVLLPGAWQASIKRREATSFSQMVHRASMASLKSRSLCLDARGPRCHYLVYPR